MEVIPCGGTYILRKDNDNEIKLRLHRIKVFNIIEHCTIMLLQGYIKLIHFNSSFCPSVVMNYSLSLSDNKLIHLVQLTMESTLSKYTHSFVVSMIKRLIYHSPVGALTRSALRSSRGNGSAGGA